MNESDGDRDLWDVWGVRAPTHPPARRPSHTPEEVARLARLLQAEPDIAGRLRDVAVNELQARASGAAMLYGTWDGTTRLAHADALGTDAGDAGKAPASGPAIVKLGATAREVHWAPRLSRHAPDLVPHVYASGSTLGGEPVPWLVMERCPYRLDYTWGHHLYTMVMDAGVRFHVAARQVAPPVGPADVPLAWHFDRVRRAVTNDPPAPGPAGRVADRLADDWAWVLSVCRVEFAHGDLHLNNAVWRKSPPDPDAKALLVDYWPNPAPWATEPERRQCARGGRHGTVRRGMAESRALARIHALRRHRRPAANPGRTHGLIGHAIGVRRLLALPRTHQGPGAWRCRRRRAPCSTSTTTACPSPTSWTASNGRSPPSGAATCFPAPGRAGPRTRRGRYPAEPRDARHLHRQVA